MGKTRGGVDIREFRGQRAEWAFFDEFHSYNPCLEISVDSVPPEWRQWSPLRQQNDTVSRDESAFKARIRSEKQLSEAFQALKRKVAHQRDTITDLCAQIASLEGEQKKNEALQARLTELENTKTPEKGSW